VRERDPRPSDPDRPGHRAPRGPRARLARALAALAVTALAVGPLVPAASGADAVTMTARVLLQGHARAGSWMAVEVRLENAGPALTGELHLEGGTSTKTRFASAVDLPTASRKTYVLYAQPPAFGRSLKIDLVATDGSPAGSTSVAYLAHDLTQLVVGVVAERPDRLVGDLDLPPSINNNPSVIAPLTVADLPDRVEGWAPLDRLIWQDVDASTLSTAQIAALHGWLAAGGRLVIVAGTAGIGTLAGFPDDLLPYRPTATADLGADLLADLLGGRPVVSSAVPMLVGAPGTGRPLVQAGDRWSSAERTYGNGTVTVLGFDPATPGVGTTEGMRSLWQRLLPPRSGTSPAFSDDSNLLSAAGQMPSLALPPIGGLLILLIAYIAIIGPVNYLILRRLDRRELAWVTMPVLVAGFAIAAYGYGGFLRGTDVVVNQVAIVRGAPDATEGSATVYFGLFSPDRRTYQLEIPGGALLAAPIAGDLFGTGGTAASLDIVQGDPARVRDLEVGYASLRTVRGETATSVPRMRANFLLDGTTLRGTFENASDRTLEDVAVVLGSSVVVLGDIAAHTSKAIILPITSDPFGQSLADKVLGPIFGPGGAVDDASRQRSVRYALINQLVADPTGMGFYQAGLAAEQPVILAFTSDPVLDVRVSGQTPRATGSILYYVPVPMSVRGDVTFGGDLMRSTTVDTQSMFFSKDPYTISLQFGKVTVAYRPVDFGGTLTPTAVRFVVDFPGNATAVGDGQPLEPLASVPPACALDGTGAPDCVQPRVDGMPEVEVWDRAAADWVRLPRVTQGVSYELADPARYVDPQTGTVLVRFVNDNSQGMQATFSFRMSISGTVR
jgi:hypothetical protein